MKFANHSLIMHVEVVEGDNFSSIYALDGITSWTSKYFDCQIDKNPKDFLSSNSFVFV